MKKSLSVFPVIIIMVALIPFLYLAWIYPQLPQKIVTHSNLEGTPLTYRDKSFLWFVISITASMSIFVFLFMQWVPRIDPKRFAKYSAPVLNKISVAVVLFLCGIGCIIINASKGYSSTMIKAVCVLLGVFFAFMGNIMPTFKPNYFVGIRTPWTLESEQNWRKTHNFAGKLWFGGGVLMVIMSLICPTQIDIICIISIALILVAISIGYSYSYFKNYESPLKRQST